MNLKKLTDKMAKWQKILLLVSSIITSVVVIYPYGKSAIDKMKIFIDFQRRATHIEQMIDNHDKYIKVLTGILCSSLQPINDKTYGVELYVTNQYTKQKEVRVVEAKIRTTDIGDLFVFVDDGMSGMYSVKHSVDTGRYSYIDFNGDEHQIYEATFTVTIRK